MSYRYGHGLTVPVLSKRMTYLVQRVTSHDLSMRSYIDLTIQTHLYMYVATRLDQGNLAALPK